MGDSGISPGKGENEGGCMAEVVYKTEADHFEESKPSWPKSLTYTYISAFLTIIKCRHD